MTTAAERGRRIDAAQRRISKNTAKALTLRAEADTLDAIVTRSRAELDWWKDAPVTDPPSDNTGGDPTTDVAPTFQPEPKEK